MILLSIPPLACRQDLSHNASLPPLIVRLLCDILCDLLLLIIMIEDAAPVLRADIWTLSVRCGRVVHLVEVFEDLAV